MPEWKWPEEGSDDSKPMEKYPEDNLLTDTAEIWWWLNDHPAFEDRNGCNRFLEIWSLGIVKENPETGMIDYGDSKNTEVNYWMECGRWIYPPDGPEDGCAEHDITLDCGAPKFEMALMYLYLKVMQFYGGDYRESEAWKERQRKRRQRAEVIFKAMEEHKEEDGYFVWPEKE